MGTTLRVVTKLPAPDCLQEYEPFRIKGPSLSGRRIGLQTLSDLDIEEKKTLDEAMVQFFAGGGNGGVWPTAMFPKAVIFSLNMDCTSPSTLPGNFELFLTLCHSLEVEVYLMGNKEAPIATQVYTVEKLFACHQICLLPGEPCGGLRPELCQPIQRVAWVIHQLESHSILPEQTVLVTDRVEDKAFEELCPYRVFMGTGPFPLSRHGQIPSLDCAYLAYLLLGREVTAVRRPGY